MPIPKAGGGIRDLHIPSIPDRVVERALSQVVARLIDPDLSPWSFAYRPGLGTADAVNRLAELRDAGAGWVARADIAGFFDSIPRDRLLAAFADHLDDPWTLDLIERLLARGYRSGHQLLERVRGVSQGAPMSPLLANVYLDALDQRLVRGGWSAVRFADDLAVACAAESDAAEAVAALDAATADLGLSLNADKTRIESFAEGVAFVGSVVTAVDPPPDLPDVQEPDRRVLHVTRPGALVRTRQGQVHVSEGDEDLLSVPISHVGQVVVSGPVGVSAGLRWHAFRSGMEVTFLTRNGGWLGRLDTGPNGHVRLRRRQYRFVEDAAARSALARSIVAGKIANQRALLLRYARRDGANEVVDRAEELKGIRREVLHADDIPSILGHEGAAARAYFSSWPAMLPEEAGFDGRNRRPPRDPVNAALSFGYTLLLSETVAALATYGLDPYLGVLHVEGRRRPALALYLMEEFRPLVVDTIAIGLFRRGSLAADDFETSVNTGGVRFTDTAKRRYLAAYEQRLLTRFGHVPSRQRLTYRRAIGAQARAIAAHIEGLVAEYQPVSWR